MRDGPEPSDAATGDVAGDVLRQLEMYGKQKIS